MAINQAYLFLIFTSNGIFIGLLFDFFRILRKSFKTTNLVTNIEDIIFWISTALSIIFCMYKFTDGNIRLFMFLGLIFGFSLYMLILSHTIIKITTTTILIIKKIIKKIIKILLIPFKILRNIIDKVFLRPIYLICINIRFFTTKKIKIAKYHLKNTKKVQKTWLKRRILRFNGEY